ncbi:MAG: glycosyltransferase family 39 protein, partial [candidate division KSB1 bacterium]|nr:glycosyltransferase family 39 protein [candidate division KSB1 bacterium]
MSEIKRNRHVFQKYEIYLLMALLILSSLLRIYRLDHQSYWTDEIITIKAAKQSAAQLLFHPTITNNAPPLYFLMSHFLLQLNQRNAELMLRLPSALFGILSVALFYLVVRKLLGKRMGFMASMLMALSPFHIWYSQEARPYALLLFLSLLSLWLFQELISKPQNQWLKAGFIGSAALTFYCHTIAIAFIGALFIYLLIFFKNSWTYWLKILFAIIILMIPALFYLILNPPASGGDPHRSTKIFTSIAYTIWTFSTGFSLGPSLTEWHAQDKLKILLSYLHLILPIMVLVSSLLGLGVIKLYKNYKQAFWISLLLFTCPLFFAIL